MLDVHAHLGGEAVRGAVQGALEVDAVVVDAGPALMPGGDDVVVLEARGVHGEGLPEARAEAHHLETAGVGEGGPGPAHEAAQAARRVDDPRPGLEVQVEGVGQHGLASGGRDLLGQHGLDGRLRPDDDERRGPDRPVRRRDRPRAPQAVGQPRARGEAEVVLGGHGDDCGRTTAAPGPRERVRPLAAVGAREAPPFRGAGPPRASGCGRPACTGIGGTGELAPGRGPERSSLGPCRSPS